MNVETVREIKSSIAADLQNYDTRRVMDMCRAEITYGIPIDRLRELAEAEKDGRLVVLPCKAKVGDT